MSSNLKIVHGNFINPISAKQIEFYQDTYMILEKFPDGFRISNMIPELKFDQKKFRGEILDFRKYLIIPSFVDLHFHWVQEDVCPKPKKALLEWLNKVVFPIERKYGVEKYSENRAKKFREKLIQNGTLAGAIYGSIHDHTIDHADKYFLGDFIIGNVLMTMNSPKFLVQSSQVAQASCIQNAKKFKNYAITPRFALSVDPETLKFSAQIAKKNNLFVQTHLSETQNEIKEVLSSFKKFKDFKNISTYTQIYDQLGLLHEKTILGHGIFLSDQEKIQLAQKNVSIAHCPTSNAPRKMKGLGSGLCDTVSLDHFKIRWALASDIGAGPYLSMLDVMNSYVVQNQKVNNKHATYSHALYRSTLAGAEILQMQKNTGSFSPGKFANFLVIPYPKTKSTKESPEGLLTKIISKTPRSEMVNHIKKTYHKGECVFDTNELV